MKEVPKKDQPGVAGGYISNDFPDNPLTPTPWTPIDPDPIVPEPSDGPCESPLP